MRTLLRALAVVAVATLLAGGLASGAGAAEPGLEADFVARLNGVRAGVGLPPLAVDGELTAVARAWSDRMAAAGAISHNPSVGAQISAPWTTVGENVGAGPEVGGIMAAFVASPGHHENIVDPIFDEVGVGVTWGTDGRMYTTHVFMDLDGGVTTTTSSTSSTSTSSSTSSSSTSSTPSSTSSTTPTTTPPVPTPPPPPPAPAPPPAAIAPDRVATVLALVGALDAGVR